MVVLLDCQRREILDSDNIEAFAIALLYHLLEMHEGDLSVSEERDIKEFCKDWSKK